MGMFLNPGNDGFADICRDNYVDKTGLIAAINSTIETSHKLTCVSRPRRFGKSYAAQMLCAYYDKSCDSHLLFDTLEIAKSQTYEAYLNHYDVLYLNMTDVIGETIPGDFLAYIKRNIIREIKNMYPDLTEEESFVSTLLNAVKRTGEKFEKWSKSSE